MNNLIILILCLYIRTPQLEKFHTIQPRKKVITKAKRKKEIGSQIRIFYIFMKKASFLYTFEGVPTQ